MAPSSMRPNLILTGDINMLSMTAPTIPFARVRDRLHAVDVMFTNLECCFYEPDGERSPEEEGFYAPLKENMATLRSQADVVIASHHWGLAHKVLDYQVEIAHTAIDAGAALVMDHGPQMPLGIELYKGKPIFYGVGSFSRRLGSSA